MDKITESIQAFEKDYADYLGIYRAGMEQEKHIANEDIGRFERQAGVVQQYMDRIRLRKRSLPVLTPEDYRNNSALEARRKDLVEMINKIDQQRRLNETRLHKALDRTRAEMKQFQQSRRAVRGYGKKKGQGGRFVDGLR